MTIQYSMRLITAGVVASIVLLFNAGCATDGGPSVLSDNGITFGGSLEDSEPLTVQVRQRLKNNGQTALAFINVSSPGDDTVRLAGTVQTDAVRQVAERLAYEVDGVRYVVNTLEVSN